MQAEGSLQYRTLTTPHDYEECVEMQRVTWGRDFKEVVTPITLMLTQKVGGVAAGAFDPKQRMVGFVYGLTGFYRGAPFHWSHMLAVRPELEGRGVGTKLKEWQRAWMLEMGIKLMRWSFDPLVARNAHLNYNRLGAFITEYVPDMYGANTGSLLHSGLGTDRFVVDWRLDDSSVQGILEGRPPEIDADAMTAPIVNTESGPDGIVPVDRELPEAQSVRIEIPSDIEQIKAESMTLGMEWRNNTKRACRWYLERGYLFESFYRDAETGRCFYHVKKARGS